MTCPVCNTSYSTERGLKIHYARSGHGKTARAQIRAQEVLASRAAGRPIPCPYPGCQSKFRSKTGLRIHQSLMGHQPPKDQYEKGDGPASVRRTRRNAIPTPIPTTPVCTSNFAGTDNDLVTLMPVVVVPDDREPDRATG